MNPLITDEIDIIWLAPREYVQENYDYLRETSKTCCAKSRFSVKDSDHVHRVQGGPCSHIVAYAVLSPGTKSGCSGVFERRVWWVKGYDRFKGHHTPLVYGDGCPCEAVLVDSIQPGHPSKAGCLTRDH